MRRDERWLCMAVIARIGEEGLIQVEESSRAILQRLCHDGIKRIVLSFEHPREQVNHWYSLFLLRDSFRHACWHAFTACFTHDALLQLPGHFRHFVGQNVQIARLTVRKVRRMQL